MAYVAGVCYTRVIILGVIYGFYFIAVPVMHAGQVLGQGSASVFSRFHRGPIFNEKEAEEALNPLIILTPLKDGSCPKLRRGAGRAARLR